MLLCFRREIFGDVDLAECFAHLAIDAAGAALPAFLLFFGAVENVRVEVPVFGFEGLWHAGASVGVEQVPAQVSADLVEGRVGQERVEFGKELRLHVVGFADGGSVSRLNVIIEIEMREHPSTSRQRQWGGSGFAGRDCSVMVSDDLASRVSMAITASASFEACASGSPASTNILRT